MYAVIEVGARQYNVKAGDVIDVEKQEVTIGKEIKLGNVLLLSKDKKIEVGQPYLKEAKVLAVALKQVKDEKKLSFKYRRRKSSHWTKGHRQNLTRFKIKEIQAA